MLLSTTDNLEKKYEVLGLVKGNTIQSRHVGRDIMAGFKQIIGGEIKSYTQMLDKARQQAVKRMEDEAKELGADAIIEIRFTTSSIMQAASEVLAYGTAIKYLQ